MRIHLLYLLALCFSGSLFSEEYCAFCDPKVIEAQKFYEDELVYALYTHKPIFPGHCLVIPKRHVERFEMLSDDEMLDIGEVIKKVNCAVSDVFDTSAYLLLQKNGREVGQTVPHVHFHYIPRKAGDDSELKFILKMFIANIKSPISAEEMQVNVGKLKESITKSEPIEYAYQTTPEEKILKDHFNSLYIVLAQGRLIPSAAFETVDGMQRGLSGISYPFHNALIGCPSSDWDLAIDRQLNYFRAAQVPFVWYVDEQASEEFKQTLKNHGFQDLGIFRGVMGKIDASIPDPEIPDGYAIELVQDEKAMDEFNDLLCATFGIEGVAKEMFRKVQWEATEKEPKMYHWVARKDGRVVSTLSTVIVGDMVSFWNGASSPELRRQGLSTAIRRFALKDAVARGCCQGSSYIMAEGFAVGICTKLGYETKWRFHAFLAPLNRDVD